MMNAARAAQSGDFTYEVATNSTVTITAYSGEGGNVVIPDTIEGSPVVNVGSQAFFGDGGIQQLVIGAHVASIGTAAFSGCTGLVSVTLPHRLMDVGPRAFSDCPALGSVVLPDRVSSIGAAAFSGCVGLTNLVLSTGLRSIPPSAFQDCRGLGSLTLPDSVIVVRSNAFSHCHRLATLRLSTNLVSVEAEAFGYANQLTQVVLPASLASLSGDAFKGCEALTSIEVAAENSRLASREGVVFNHDFSTLLIYPSGRGGSYSVPDSVVTIVPQAFAFSSRLQSVSVGAKVANIGVGAFQSCPRLSAILVNAANTNYSGKDGVLFSKLNNMLLQFPAGKGGSYTVTASWPGTNAFADCVNLTNVVFSTSYLFSSFTTLNPGVFSGCINLESVVLPAGVSNVAAGAFAHCPGLKALYFKGNAPGYWGADLFAGDSQLTLYRLAGAAGWNYTSVQGCPVRLWKDFTGYSYTRLSDTTIAISSYATSSKSMELNVPESIDGMTVVSIGNSAFASQYQLRSVILPDTVTNIGKLAFKNCTLLTNLSLPKGLTQIEQEAFSQCYMLSQVELPEGLLSLGQSAFQGCSKLRDITLPASLKSVGSLAFSNCDALRSVVVRSSLEVLGSKAFSGCSQLSQLIFYGNSPAALGTSVLATGAKVKVYHLAKGSGWTDTWLGMPVYYWTEVASVSYRLLDAAHAEITDNLGAAVGLDVPAMVDGAEVTRIADGAFGTNALINVTLPDSVTALGNSSFRQCRSLRFIALPRELTSLGSYAFASCDKLVDIALPASLSQLGDYGFNFCAALETIVLPDGLKRVPNGLFYGCSNLVNVTLSQQTTNLGSYAFAQCVSLDTLVLPKTLDSIDPYAFAGCAKLRRLVFHGNAPTIPSSTQLPDGVTVFYFVGASGWGETFAGRPTVELARPVPFAPSTAERGPVPSFSDAEVQRSVPDLAVLAKLQETDAAARAASAQPPLVFISLAPAADLSGMAKASVAAAPVALTLQTIPGETYAIERCEQLNGAWSIAATVTATAAQTRVVLSRPATAAFYRVRVQP
jgi:hypothetical protein